MKVAVLTQPLGHNYGGLLQAYALQTYLKKLGCEVETLDRRSKNPGWMSLRSHILNLARLALGRIKSLPTSKREAGALIELAAFRDTRLMMSPTISSEKEVRDYFREREFSAFVVGSDQVWRPQYSPSILNFYLDFLNDIESSSKRIAYAASFGVDEWEYTDELSKRCGYLAQNFDAISVRERSAVGLCNQHLGVTAEWVVDPTLLLEPEEYDTLINCSSSSENADTMLLYILDPTMEKRDIVDFMADFLRLETFSVKPENSVSQVRARDLGKCKYPSVESWLQSVRDSSYVVTDSFHGTVFSILFNKPFISIGNSDRGLARFESLLSQFGLTDRLVQTCEDVSEKLMSFEIDWGSVNSKRRTLALEGQEFLKTNIFGI